jgi:SpoVK/Ycf46/Vps4 family AAA+-type ATPase
VGGLRALRNFLADTRALRDDWRANPGDDRLTSLIPKGMLLLGLPGCGKSLAAELTAKEFDEPLLQLHAGRLMGAIPR